MPSSNVTIRLDDDLKREADALLSDLGMTLSGAVNVFLRQCIRDGGLPFTPSTRTSGAVQTRVEYALVDLPEK